VDEKNSMIVSECFSNFEPCSTCTGGENEQPCGIQKQCKLITAIIQTGDDEVLKKIDFRKADGGYYKIDVEKYEQLIRNKQAEAIKHNPTKIEEKAKRIGGKEKWIVLSIQRFRESDWIAFVGALNQTDIRKLFPLLKKKGSIKRYMKIHEAIKEKGRWVKGIQFLKNSDKRLLLETNDPEIIKAIQNQALAVNQSVVNRYLTKGQKILKDRRKAKRNDRKNKNNK